MQVKKKKNQSTKMDLANSGLVTFFFCFFFLSLNTGERRNELSVNLSPRLILLLEKKKKKKTQFIYPLLFFTDIELCPKIKRNCSIFKTCKFKDDF